MNARYERERNALAEREGDTVDITNLGGPIQIMDLSPTSDDYTALARRAYIRGDLTIEEFEAELDRIQGWGAPPDRSAKDQHPRPGCDVAVRTAVGVGRL